MDLELVFAVDTSRSMDYEEQLLQREGYALALVDPAVIEAIRSGPNRRIVIAYVEWSGPFDQRVILDWTEIGSREEAEQAAAFLRAVPVETASGTSISGGLRLAADLIEENGYDGLRRVIDVSGDGPNNTGEPVATVRDDLVGRGFEINGLPLMLKEPSGLFAIADLDIYYEECVIGGPAAFVIPVRDRAQIATAIRQKLVMEISGTAPAPRLRPASATDCLIGEKMRRRWLEYQGGG